MTDNQAPSVPPHLQRLHILIAETKRVIADGNGSVAFRKLDALDELIRELPSVPPVEARQLISDLRCWADRSGSVASSPWANGLVKLLHQAADALEAALPHPQGWQPISTAPRDVECWFWLRPKTADETYADTSGRPILIDAAPFLKATKFGQWGSLWTATHWQPHIVPAPPVADPRGGPQEKHHDDV